MPRHIWIVNFKRYHPPHKAVNADVRNGAPLKWIRLQSDWYDDEDVLDLPEAQRWLWPALCALAGKSSPPGRIDKTTIQLARELRVAEISLKSTLDFLWRRKKIRFSKQGSS